MLRTIRQGQVAQVRQVLEDEIDVKVLELCDDEAKDLITGSLKLPFDLFHVARGLEILEQALDVRFNIGLLEAIAMLLALDVLAFHI